MLRLNAAQLRVTKPTQTQLKQVRRHHRQISLILDSVQDTYNIGGLFRLADAAGVKKVFLCGATECPPNTRIHKAAVGLEHWVDWEYHASATQLIKQLKTCHPQSAVLAIEQSKNSILLKKLPKLSLPIHLVVGHETRGVNKDILQLSDFVVELPMLGINRSLNVVIAAAAVLYHPSLSSAIR